MPIRLAGTSWHPLSVWRELLLVALFYAAYTVTRLIVSPTSAGAAFAHAGDILSLERAMGIDVELGLNQALVGVPWLARVANFFYATAHFVVTLSVLIWLYRRRPAHYRRLRTALMAATAIALTGFWFYPLAPPRLIGHGFVDPVTALHSFGLYSGHGSGELTNQFAAMPSMHAGWALWCGFVLIRLGRRPWVRLFGAVYPVVTVLVILSTANHYVVDAIAGFVIVTVTLTASWLTYRHLLLKKESELIREAGHKLTTPACIGDMPRVRV
ncbi:MAG TPA: phosphatase PAP2 family protein [Streptosporangiaceae bacterium]